MLTIATLTKVHGIRGELKVRCEMEYLAFLREAAEEAVPLTLRLPDTGDEYEVTFASVRGHESAPIVAIDGVEDRTSAEEYRGAEVRAPRELLPEPEEDEFFLADLERCEAFDHVTGALLGKVTRADALPANVVLTIKLVGGETILAPLAGDAVPEVNVAEGRITLDVAFLGVGEPDDPEDHP